MIRSASKSGACRLPLHHVYVSTHPDEPGANASCIDEAGYEIHLIEWMAEQVLAGYKIQRVTCDEAHAMLKQHAAWIDQIP